MFLSVDTFEQISNQLVVKPAYANDITSHGHS
jgi:hypothetical protein